MTMLMDHPTAPASDAQRRANGEGSVFKSASRGWLASITDADGRRVTRKAPVQTRAAAERLLRRLLRERDAGAVARRSPPLATFIPEWLEAAALRGCRPRSLEAYEDKLRAHVLPTLGQVCLDRLTPGQVERLYAQKLAAGLSPKSIDLLHTALNGVLKLAQRRGIIARNALELVERPRVPKFEARPLSLEDAKRLLLAAPTHRYGALWTFLVGTGTRFGEAAGLTWDSVDLDAPCVFIRQAAVRTRKNGKTRIEIAATKTAAGNRTVPLPAWVVETLKKQRARVAELRLAAGPVWNGHNLVFPSAVGTPLRESHVREAWIPFLKCSGLPPRTRMHDLRHSYATIMLDSGEDLVAVQRTLGHSRVSITADLYVGRVPAAQKRAVERYGELLAPASAAKS